MSVITQSTTQNIIPEEPLIFERSQDDKRGYLVTNDHKSFSSSNILQKFSKESLRNENDLKFLPQLSEPEVIRHYTRLSLKNYQIDLGIYPLGSCTMKYNPRINEDLARQGDVAHLHPMTPGRLSQGHLQIMWELEKFLGEITGLPAVSLQPAAGAQGEFTAIKVAQAYFHSKNLKNKTKIITTDSAHGTNPATAALCGYEVIEIPTSSQGVVTKSELEKVLTDEVAVLMVTNPNTLGKFEKDIFEISEMVHAKGGLVYCDGANLNAIMGITRPGDFGADIMHINLHKTFSTPHGGGGPGSGPICCREFLRSFLPIPQIKKNGSEFFLDHSEKLSIGKVKSFYGNFGMFIRAWTYILSHGGKGLKEISENAILNANYIKSKLVDLFPEPFPGDVLHEVVLSDKKIKSLGLSTSDIAKALLDYGIHPPTVHFPLIAKGALMVEPTESEGKDELDRFINAMRDIYARTESGELKPETSPLRTPRQKIDETTAARHPILKWENLSPK